MLLPEGVRIGERATCLSLGSPDGVSPDSEARHESSGGWVPTPEGCIIQLQFIKKHSSLTMVQLHFFWNPICSMSSVPYSPQPTTSLTSNGATVSFLVEWCLLFRQSCLLRKFNGATAPFLSLNGAAAPL